MKKYKAIIFDLDGTLLDTLDDLKDSVNAALSEYGCPERSKEEIRQFVGNGIARLIELSVPETTTEADFKQIFSFFKQHYENNCKNKTKPYDGTVSVLKALKENGFLTAIVSNKIDSAVKELNELYFKNLIDIAIGESEKIRRKPNPDMINEILKSFSLDKSECVFIGDSDVDVQTAKNAGLDCISVLWGFRTKEELIKSGAERFVSTPEELIDVLLN